MAYPTAGVRRASGGPPNEELTKRGDLGGRASTDQLVPWTRRGDPICRLCPLGVPTEAMAH
jgi:hypothetical protein